MDCRHKPTHRGGQFWTPIEGQCSTPIDSNSGDALWYAASGRSYADYLSGDDLACLRTYFQRRHLLAHKNGFVEQDYLDRSGDTAYAIGQRLVVRAAEVENLTRLVETLVTAMRET
jgi:hypothetical protein